MGKVRDPRTRTPGATKERLRRNLPSDTRLWTMRTTWTMTDWVVGSSADFAQAHQVLAERGWKATREPGVKRMRLSQAPCRECGRSFEFGARHHRACDDCEPPAAAETWRADYERELARVMEKRRAEQAAVSAMVKEMVDRQGDPLRRKPGRPRNRRSA